MLDDICNGEYETNRVSLLEIAPVRENSSRTTAVFMHLQRSSTSHALYFAIPRHMIYFSVKWSDYGIAMFGPTSTFKVFCCLLKEVKHMLFRIT
jgi:hypothetical protein